MRKKIQIKDAVIYLIKVDLDFDLLSAVLFVITNIILPLSFRALTGR